MSSIKDDFEALNGYLVRNGLRGLERASNRIEAELKRLRDIVNYQAERLQGDTIELERLREELDDRRKVLAAYKDRLHRLLAELERLRAGLHDTERRLAESLQERTRLRKENEALKHIDVADFSDGIEGALAQAHAHQVEDARLHRIEDASWDVEKADGALIATSGSGDQAMRRELQMQRREAIDRLRAALKEKP